MKKEKQEQWNPPTQPPTPRRETKSPSQNPSNNPNKNPSSIRWEIIQISALNLKNPEESPAIHSEHIPPKTRPTLEVKSQDRSIRFSQQHREVKESGGGGEEEGNRYLIQLKWQR